MGLQPQLNQMSVLLSEMPIHVCVLRTGGARARRRSAAESVPQYWLPGGRRLVYARRREVRVSPHGSSWRLATCRGLTSRWGHTAPSARRRRRAAIGVGGASAQVARQMDARGLVTGSQDAWGTRRRAAADGDEQRQVAGGGGGWRLRADCGTWSG